MLLAITFLGSDVKLHVFFPDILLQSFTATYLKPQYAFLRTTSVRFASELSKFTDFLRELGFTDYKWNQLTKLKENSSQKYVFKNCHVHEERVRCVEFHSIDVHLNLFNSSNSRANKRS